MKNLKQMSLRELRALQIALTAELGCRFGLISNEDLKPYYAKINKQLKQLQNKLNE